MRRPRYWDSVFSMNLINAYENGEVTRDEGSIRKWYDEYNKPDGTTASDVDDIQNILEYYDAGHRLGHRPALERVVAVQKAVKQKTENRQ